MIATDTAKGRIVDAALKLAADRPWRDIALIDIAEAAGMTLGELRPHIRCKADVVRAFMNAIDEEVLRKAARRPVGSAPRDALFEVLMSRLDALQPHKAAVRSILRDTDPDPSVLKSMMASQHWMLQAAGIDTAGARGAVRTLGLASVYASVFHTWLDDDDPGLARTMAALDRRLRRGEQNLQVLEGVCGFASRFGEVFRARARRQAQPPYDVPPASNPVSDPPPAAT